MERKSARSDKKHKKLEESSSGEKHRAKKEDVSDDSSDPEDDRAAETKSKVKKFTEKERTDLFTKHSKGMAKIKCFCCLKTLWLNKEFDCGHILPAWAGGSHEAENIRIVCRRCNGAIGSGHMYAYIVDREFWKNGSPFTDDLVYEPRWERRKNIPKVITKESIRKFMHDKKKTYGKQISKIAKLRKTQYMFQPTPLRKTHLRKISLYSIKRCFIKMRDNGLLIVGSRGMYIISPLWERVLREIESIRPEIVSYDDVLSHPGHVFQELLGMFSDDCTQLCFGDEIAIKTIVDYCVIERTTKPWTPLLLSIRKRVNKLHPGNYDMCIVRLFRNGKSYTLPYYEKTKDTPIVCLSLGEARRFHQHWNDRHLFEWMTNNSMKVFKPTHEYYSHSIFQDDEVTLPHITVTFVNSTEYSRHLSEM